MDILGAFTGKTQSLHCLFMPCVPFKKNKSMAGTLSKSEVSFKAIKRECGFKDFTCHASDNDVGTREVGNADCSSYMSAVPIILPEGPWNQVPGGVTAANGFKASGMYAGLRAAGKKPDLALVTCDVDAVSAGAFTQNVVAAAPVIYCRKVLKSSSVARGILINAGQANAATGDAGYQDTVDCAEAAAKLLGVQPESILIESTGVIGQRIRKETLLKSLPNLVAGLSSTVEGNNLASVAITTTDLFSKSAAMETKIGGRTIKIGGIAKGSGMIHPNMATMLSVITSDVAVGVDLWRQVILKSVKRSFNQITVDGDSSTNDTVIALASGLAGGRKITSIDSLEAHQLQQAVDVIMQGLAKSIAYDGEGATCLIEVTIRGADSETSAAKVARSVASSSLVKAAIYGRDPNWGRIACAVGYAGIAFDPSELHISLGDILLMDKGQPLDFDRESASAYLRKAGETHGTVSIDVSIGSGKSSSQAWGCDLSHDYIRINAEYTT
eukprot:TRINITY_DN12742_c0_g1_i1.p1 TRINITY_DN12742_c0_g1~~TRINITY_DN12742_c0_g1_i1.p1  ORF type:complete len:498 (-),score=120.31 TRINITY_DN12742_c0_g1_i1:19-1512(-)